MRVSNDLWFNFYELIVEINWLDGVLLIPLSIGSTKYAFVSLSIVFFGPLFIDVQNPIEPPLD